MGIDLLNFDASVVYQLFLYGITAMALIHWMVRPVVATLVLRRHLAVPAAQDDEMTSRLKDAQARYGELLQTARAESAALRQQLRDKAQLAERELIGEAQTRAGEVNRTGRAALAEQVGQVRADMQSWVPRMAGELAGKILGREL